MADVNVENRSSSANQSQQESRSALQRSQGGGGLSRSRGWDPFGSFFLNPSEFFSNPFALMRRMSEEMDRSFGRFYGEGASGQRGGWLPAIEVAEREGQLHVHAELPGVKPEDVKVEVANEALIIQGERRSQHEEGSGANYRSERRYGSFYREIPLPEGVNADQAKAQFRDGVLEISIPVPQQASQRRQIPITGGTGTGSTSTAAAGAGSSGGSGTTSTKK